MIIRIFDKDVSYALSGPQIFYGLKGFLSILLINYAPALTPFPVKPFSLLFIYIKLS